MKYMTRIILSFLLIAGVTACEKDTEAVLFPPELTTGEPMDITRFDAVLSGRLTPNPRSPEGQEHLVYFMYSALSPSLLENVDTISAVRGEDNSCTAKLTKLEAGKKYYYCLAAGSGYSIVKGQIRQFTTKATAEPTVDILVNSTTEFTLSLTGNVIEDGGAQIRTKGFVYKPYIEGEDEPTTENGTNVPGNQGAGTDFYAEITGLTPETDYIIRAYASNGTTASGYSEAIIVKTSKLLVPLVNTASVSDLTAYSVVFHGKILSDNGFPVKECGFCYSSESAAPTMDHPYVKAISTGSDFTAEAKGLEPTKTYNYRAYAVNAKGVAYGEVIQCTLPQVQTLTLTTPSVNNITINSADVLASVNLPSDASFTEKGVCYSSTVTLPTINEMLEYDISEGNQIAVSLQSLKEGTTYHLRAFVISRDGVFYSSPVQFKTVEYFRPTVTELIQVSVGDDRAVMKAMLVDNGGLAIKEVGFCWSANSSEPIINQDSKVIATLSGNSFESSLTGLAYNTNYYVRAYAINDKGIGYSGFVQIHTLSSDQPTLGSLVADNVTPSTVDVSATISNDGGASIEEKGFCYSLQGTPVLTDHMVVVSGSGNALQTTLVGLNSNTKYYIRAFAKNKNGVSYSNLVTVTTKKTNPSITDPVSPGSK